MTVARWRKTKRVLYDTNPPGCELTLKGELIAKVSSRECGWYWYGLGRNTAAEGKYFKTMEEAKTDATDAYKATKGEHSYHD